MAVNTYEMWSSRIKKLFFPKNLRTSPSGWGLCPQAPLCNIFEYTSLLNKSPKLDLHFPTISFRSFSSSKAWLSANGLQLQIFHSTISLPNKKFLFWEFLMTSLHVICGLPPPPQIKNPGYAYGLESVCPRKGCPWPWPRIFLCPWPWALCPRLHLCVFVFWKLHFTV